MPSSFNVIKNPNIQEQGQKEIVTAYTSKRTDEINEVNAKNNIESYETLARNMLENARRQAEAVISNAYAEAQTIEEEAFQKAYEAGMQQGYETGYNEGSEKGYHEAYELNIQKALRESESLISNANRMLQQAKGQYEQFIKEREVEIKELIFTTIEKLILHKVQQGDGMNEVILQLLEDVKHVQNIIIKGNSCHMDALNGAVEDLKRSTVFRGEIFLLSDDRMDAGSVTIEQDSGQISINVSEALQKVKSILEGND